MMNNALIPDDVRAKALAVLRTGTLRLLTVAGDVNGKPTFVDGIVYGHSGEHMVQYGPRVNGGVGWSCSCRDGRDGHVCPHVFAAEMVTHCVIPHGTSQAPKAKPVRVRS